MKKPVHDKSGSFIVYLDDYSNGRVFESADDAWDFYNDSKAFDGSEEQYCAEGFVGYRVNQG